MRSFFILLGNDSSLFNLDFFYVFSDSTLNSLDNVRLISFEGIKISASSDFEFGDFNTFFHQDGKVDAELLFLVALVLLFSLPLGSFNSPKNSFALVISLGLIKIYVPLALWLYLLKQIIKIYF